MKISQLQLAFFYDVNTPIDFDGLSYFARLGIKNIYDRNLTNNQMLGIVPKDAPPEIPRLQLSSEDNKIRMLSTLQRSDLFVDRLFEEDQTNLDSFTKIFDSFINVHAQLNKQPVRIGLVAYKTEYDDYPGVTIAKKYLNLVNIGGLDNLADANVMFNKRFEMNGQTFNCHLIHMAGFDQDKQKNLLLRQVDVSTDESRNFAASYTPDILKTAFLTKVAEF